ncbi:ribonuclease H-like YkuK family protein [Piscibacillus salipiscarius]|uniref:Ribonuclease H-like YkuK family protein n=1 Tax=Piscibacillus salipiscarius TaxID=299480 RepID=A0ABW5QBH4_9BACI|nr:ribonuclease H-like YkuK family protein [Piscibacillus salipiscarius]
MQDRVLYSSFENSKEKDMTFEQVFERILRFMRLNPNGNYKLIIGTDSQVHYDYTSFITGIVIQCEGKGVWACLQKNKIPRKITNLHQKISYETSFSEAVFAMFTQERKDAMYEIVLPYVERGASFTIEGHIDIGSGPRNKTRVFINEMIARIQSMGAEPKIKPEAFVASSYANRYTK